MDFMRRVNINPTIALLIFFVVCDTLALYTAYLNHRNKFEAITLNSVVAPDFIWQAFDGSTHKLKDLSGHAVVLHFWAAWCPPCRDEFPKLLKAAADNPDVMFLTVSSDSAVDKPQEFVKMAAATSGIAAPSNVLYAWDPNKAITYDMFLTVSYPESIIMDAGLKMRRKYPLPIDWDKQDIRAYLKEMKESK
jgi:thiol-disulfide isomerase/thioredoxin